MALIHQREIQLPSQRVQLYSLAVDVLVRRWQKGKTGELAEFLKDNLRLRTALERLAYEAHRTGREKDHAADLPRGTALTLLELPEFLGNAGLAAGFLDYVDQRAGLLVGRGGGPGQPPVYSFPHRTFQEYLAGCHLLSGRDSGRQARAFFRHAAEGDYWQLAARLTTEDLRYNVPRGINPLLDLAYRMCPADVPTHTQARRANLWAAGMALLAGKDAIERDTESPDGGAAFLKRLIPRLVSLLTSDLTPPERAEAGRNLAVFGDPRPEVVPATPGELGAMEFCYVPGGPFLAGEADAARLVEALATGYWVGRHPVTVAQFRLFVEADGYSRERFWPEAREAGFWSEKGFKGRWDDERHQTPEDYGAPFGLSNHPVVGVTWYEALAYCRWLTEGWQDRLPPGFAFVLPSEQEWEKSARGGRDIPRAWLARKLADGLTPPKSTELAPNPLPSRVYPWGDEFGADRVNDYEAGVGATSAAGSFTGGASPYGIMDLSGNVWEWTRTLDDGGEDLAAAPGKARVLRGGSWNYDRPYVRCADRLRLNPLSRLTYLGFRVVVSPF